MKASYVVYDIFFCAKKVIIIYNIYEEFMVSTVVFFPNLPISGTVKTLLLNVVKLQQKSTKIYNFN